MKTFLTRVATIKGGRSGQVKTEDNSIDLTLTRPTEMGGETNGVDPENLFAAGYASCLSSSIEFLLQQEQKQASHLEVSAKVLLVGDENGGFKFKLDVKAIIEGFDRQEAQAILDKGLAFCPYSKAIKGNVEINAELA